MLEVSCEQVCVAADAVPDISRLTAEMLKAEVPAWMIPLLAWMTMAMKWMQMSK